MAAATTSTSTYKKCWLKRLAKLRIDSDGPSAPEPPQPESTSNRNRGVFRSLRKMHNRVKSCMSRRKLRESPSMQLGSEDACKMLNSSVTYDQLILTNNSLVSSTTTGDTLNNIDLQEPTMQLYDSDNESCNPLTQEVSNLAKCCWYWGPLSRREAEKKLNDLPDGSFLIRDTSSNLHVFSISFRSLGCTFHSHIQHTSSGYSLYNQVRFPTIAKLIENAMALSKDSVYCYLTHKDDMLPTFPVRLLHPVSRFMQVRSLQYLCRFVIRQKTNISNISSLPIPVSLQNYLQQGHY